MFDVPDRDDPHDLELPSERAAREAPRQPTSEQLMRHIELLKLYEAARKAVHGSAPHHWLRCFEGGLYKEEDKELQAPDGSPLVIKVYGKCCTCNLELTLVNIHGKKPHFVGKDGADKACWRAFKKKRKMELEVS